MVWTFCGAIIFLFEAFHSKNSAFEKISISAFTTIYTIRASWLLELIFIVSSIKLSRSGRIQSVQTVGSGLSPSIGGNQILLGCTQSEICGAVVNVRNRQEKIALWAKNAANEAAQLSIGHQWKKSLDYNETIGFIFHEDAKVFERSAKNIYTV
ncbi:hypothetical protein Droror1_Dr00015694 [Drosera rotundifolia]